jgi:hypothetical protein
MLEFLKKIFSAAEPDQTPAPYKVEASAPAVPDFPVEKPAKAAKPKAEKKPVVSKPKVPRKPKTPKV